MTGFITSLSLSRSQTLSSLLPPPFPFFFIIYFSLSFHLLQNCTNMLFSYTGFGKTQNLMTGILTGFDCYLC